MKNVQKYIEGLFTNKIFLYVIVFLTIMTVLGYMIQKQYDSVLFLIAIGIIVKNFNKNMALVLLVSVFVTSLYNYIKHAALENMSGMRTDYEIENMSGMRAYDEDDDEDDDEDYDEDYDEDDDEDDDGFRSKFARKNRSKFARKNRSKFARKDSRKISEYNKIKDTYNDLIGTIREKTAQIKKMTSKLKRS